MCIGVQKAGTTSLYDVLKNHPQVCLSKKKETKFFNREQDFAKGIEYYAKNFSQANIGQVVGEIDPDNIFKKLYLD